MAQQQIVTLVDDLDGSEAEFSIEFGLDGKMYEIDLSATNAATLQKVFAEFVPVARRKRLNGGKRQEPEPSPYANTRHRTEHLSKVREWAVANGHHVAAHGRIGRDIMAAYQAIHGVGIAPPQQG